MELVEIWEPERCYVWMKRWLDAGINVALGSGTPTSPWYKSQVTLFGAVARLGADNKPFHPEQAIIIQESLYAHTTGSARAAFEENVNGWLEPGKFAGLVVWSRDFYSSPTRDLLKVNANLTIINDEIQ